MLLRQLQMTNQELGSLTLELAKYNSRLVEDIHKSDSILQADIDGSIISEWRLGAFLHRFNIPFQEVVFRYSLIDKGLALPGRYWAFFHT